MKAKEKYIYEGICYVLLRTDKIHPIAHDRFEFQWYPEDGMSLVKQVQYRPYVQSIVTESPWLISCYKRENVRVWDGKKWERQFIQTYGASVNTVIMELLGITQTIPAIVLDGGIEIRRVIRTANKGREK